MPIGDTQVRLLILRAVAKGVRRASGVAVGLRQVRQATCVNGTPLRFQFDPVGADLVAARACESDVFLQTYGNTFEQFA